MKLITSVSDSFSLDMGHVEEVNGVCRILPPDTMLFDQLLVWLKGKPASHTMPGPVTMGVGMTALCLRWGTYLAFLMDENKPVDLDAKDGNINMISNDEMMRINIEASRNMERMLKMLHEDRDTAPSIIIRAYDLLPVMKSKLRINKGPIHPYYKDVLQSAVALSAAFPLDPEKSDYINNHTYRVFANFMIYNTYRNGPVEDVHAGTYIKSYSLNKRRFTAPQSKDMERFTAEGMANMLEVGVPWDAQPEHWKQAVGYMASVPFMYPSEWSIDQSSSIISDIGMSEMK